MAEQNFLENLIMKSKINGVFTALVTPFINQEVDYESLERLVQFQIDGKVNGLVVNGTTGENPTLSTAEVKKVFSVVRAIAGLNMPLILGTGSNSTQDSIEKTQMAEELGADGALVVVPYYNKPPQRGIVEHFKAIAKNADIPIMAYNVPGRTITSMTEETIHEISLLKNIVAIKEATGDIEFDKKVKAKLKKDFVFMSGDDGTYIDFLKLGGDGVVSVMSNIIPAQTVKWTEQVLSGELNQAQETFNHHKSFIDSMYVESNPIPIKWMLYKLGIIKSPEMRLPLTALDTKFEKQLSDEMKKAGLL